VAAVVFSPDERRLALASNDAAVKLWNPGHGGRTTVLARGSQDADTQIGVSSTLAVAAFSPDGNTLAMLIGNDRVTTWGVANPARPRRTAVLTRRTDGAGQAAFSPHQTTVAGTAANALTPSASGSSAKAASARPGKHPPSAVRSAEQVLQKPIKRQDTSDTVH
jgi:WD40 repeat protein